MYKFAFDLGVQAGQASVGVKQAFDWTRLIPFRRRSGTDAEMRDPNSKARQTMHAKYEAGVAADKPSNLELALGYKPAANAWGYRPQ